MHDCLWFIVNELNSASKMEAEFSMKKDHHNSESRLGFKVWIKEQNYTWNN